VFVQCIHFRLSAKGLAVQRGSIKDGGNFVYFKKIIQGISGRKVRISYNCYLLTGMKFISIVLKINKQLHSFIAAALIKINLGEEREFSITFSLPMGTQFIKFLFLFH
jgi:hypothetical protein